MLRFNRLLMMLLILIGLAACRPQATPLPTATPQATPTPAPTVPTPTAIPTRAPLPTEIPREERQANNNTNTNAPTGQIRVIQGVPDLENVDVFLDDRTIAFSLRYGLASGQSTLPAGDYTLALRPTGSSLDAPTLLETPVTLTPDAPLLIVLTRQDDTLTALSHSEPTDPVQAGQTRISFIHAIPGGTETTVLLPTEFDDQPPEAAFPRITYGQLSEPYTPPLSDLELNIEDFFEEYLLTTRPRRSYTLTLVGTPDEPQIVVTDMTVETSKPVTVVNVSEEIGPVDVYLDGELALPNPVYFKTDGFIRNAVTGIHEISIYPMDELPEETEPLLTSSFNLTETGETYLVIMGPADDLTLVNHEERNLPVGPDETRITLINAVHEYPILEERRSAPTPLRVGYGQPLTRTYLSQALDFEFIVPQQTPDEDANVVEFIASTNYEARLGYIIFITGQGSDNRERYVIDRPLPRETNEEETQDTGYAHVINATNHNLEVLFNGDIADGDLPPKRGTLAQVLPPGDHSITVIDADSADVLYTDTITTQANAGYSLVFSGNAGNYSLQSYPIPADSDTQFSAVFLRMINLSGGTTRPLAFAYMPAVTPDRRLSNVIDSPQTVYSLPSQVPRVRGMNPVPSGQATTYYPVGSGQYDIHVYGTSDDRLYASVYDTSFDEDSRYEIIVLPDGDITPYEAFVVEVPVP